MIYPLTSTSQSIDIQIVDDTGLPVPALVAATFPTLTYSLAGANADVSFPALSDLATITTAYASGGVKERGGGVYRLDLPNGVFTTAGQVRVRGEATNKRVLAPWIDVAVKTYLANGDHGGVAAKITFERLIGVSTTSNQPCFSVTGNGTGEGFYMKGGVNANGMYAGGGASAGYGFMMESFVDGYSGMYGLGNHGVGVYFEAISGALETGSYGMWCGGDGAGAHGIVGFGSNQHGTGGAGLYVQGTGVAPGFWTFGGLTGPGTLYKGGDTSGAGLYTAAGGNGDGIESESVGGSSYSILLSGSGNIWSEVTDRAVGVELTSTGLDQIPTTAPTGVASTFREMLVQTWRRFFKRTVKTTTQVKTYADNGSTVLTTQAYTSVAGTDDIGAAT